MQAKKCISSHLSTLADFAIEMFDVLDEINYQSYNDFVLRVGRCLRAPTPPGQWLPRAPTKPPAPRPCHQRLGPRKEAQALGGGGGLETQGPLPLKAGT